MSAFMTEAERDLQRELQNKAIRRAGWQGWRYGLGISVLVTFGFSHAWGPGNWGWLVPAFVSGAVFGSLGDAIFRWMEVMRQKP